MALHRTFVATLGCFLAFTAVCTYGMTEQPGKRYVEENDCNDDGQCMTLYLMIMNERQHARSRCKCDVYRTL